MIEVYKSTEFNKYKDAIGDKYTPMEFKAEIGLNAKSFKITTLLTVFSMNAGLHGKILLQAILTPLEKIDSKTQRYRLEWLIVKKI